MQEANQSSSDADSQGNDAPSKRQPSATELERLEQLYRQANYRDAYELAKNLARVETWQGPRASVLAGRFAYNWGAPRLATAIHWRCGRQFPNDPSSIYYSALAYWSRFGHAHAWRKFRHVDYQQWDNTEQQADWIALIAILLGSFRDFTRADERIQQALELAPQSPWLHLQKSELLVMEDRRTEAINWVEKALQINPTFRPAVQACGHQLSQLGRDSDAVDFLKAMSQQLQSGEVWCQLAVLQTEQKQWDDAWKALDEAEKCWPLAKRDSHHLKWLAAKRCTIAVFRDDLQHAIELAKQVATPYYEGVAERLQKQLDVPKSERPKRTQLDVPFIRQHHMTCAPATLAAICGFWKMKVSHEEIAQLICYDGTPNLDQRKWAIDNGMIAREFRITVETAAKLIERGVPFTMSTVDPGNAHLQAVVGFDQLLGLLIIQDPSERVVREADADELIKHYANDGPRGMLLLPASEQDRIDDIELPDSDLYDVQYKIQLALSEHRRDDAIAHLESIKQIDAEHRLTIQSQGAIARYDGNMVAMREVNDKLLEKTPNDANLLMVRLSILSELGQRSARIEHLRKICSGTGNHPVFWTRLASELLDDARQHDEALIQLRHALRYQSSDSYTLRLMANYEWSQQRLQDANEWYRFASCASERDEELAKSYFHSSRYLNQSNEVLAWLLERFERFGKLRSQPGRTLFYALDQLDRTTEAFQILALTLAAHPTDGDLACYAAWTYARYNRLDESDHWLRKARGHCPEVNWRRTRAYISQITGDLTQSRDDFLEVLKYDPLTSSNWEQAAMLDSDLEGVEAGIQRLRSAVETYPYSYSLRTLLIQWLRSHNMSEARQQVDAFLELHPHDAWAHREATIISMRLHDWDKAEQHAEAAIEFDPTHDLPYGLLGQIRESQGRREEAKRYYRQAIERNVDCEIAIDRLIYCCLTPDERAEQLNFVFEQLTTKSTLGGGITSFREAATNRMRPAELLEKLCRLQQDRPDLWQSHSALVQQYLDMNDRENAVATAKQATERFPMLPRAWLDLATAHGSTGDDQAKLDCLLKAHAFNPSWADVAIELSECYMAKSQMDEAKRVLEQALRIDPRAVTLLGSLADCHYRQGQKSEALELLKRAASDAPAYQWAWDSLSRCSREVDEGKSAVETAQALLAKRPHDVRSHLRMAEVLWDCDRWNESLEWIDKGLRFEPRNVDAISLKAHLLGMMQRWEEAIAACSPTDFGDAVPMRLRMQAAQLFYNRGMVKEAIQRLNAALQFDRDHSEGWKMLADWADQVGEREVVVDAARNLVRINPTQAISHGYLAHTLLDNKSTRNEGIEHLETALNLQPDYGFASSKLIALYLEDKMPDKAQRVLDLAKDHIEIDLADGYQVQIFAASNTNSTDENQPAIAYLLNWCKRDEVKAYGIFMAVDSLSLDQVRTALKVVLDAATANSNQVPLGIAIGRLMAREPVLRQVSNPITKVAKYLTKLPEGKLRDEAIRTVLGSLAALQYPSESVDVIVRKHRKMLSQDAGFWIAALKAYADFALYPQAYKLSSAWRKHQDRLTNSDMVSIITASLELGKLASAKPAIDFALQLPDDRNKHLIHFWAAIVCMLEGKYQEAYDHGVYIQVDQLSAWYKIGHRVLVTGLEAISKSRREMDPAEYKEIMRLLHPSVFLKGEPWPKDRLTNNLLFRIRSTVASRRGKSFQALLNAAWAKLKLMKMI